MDRNRLLIPALLGGAAIAALTKEAEANTAFTSFSFSGSGQPGSRTMPARIADINNVKDFGAKGDNSTDDTSAIQAAINNLGAFAGIIFFPPGTYLIKSSLTFSPGGETSIIFQGCGVASTITGNFADYLIKMTPGGGSPNGECFFVQDLSLNNTNAAGGGVYITEAVGGAGVFRCKIQAFHGVTQDVNTELFAIRDCSFQTLPGTPSGSWGVAVAGSGSLVDSCIFQGIDNCIRAFSTGQFIFSNLRMEGSINTGLVLGKDLSGANSSVANVTVTACTFEGCSVAIDVINASNFSIDNCQCNLTTNAPGSAGSYGIRVRSGGSYSIRNTGINQTSPPTYSVAGLSIESQDTKVIIENTGFPSFNLGDARFSPIFVNCVSVPDGRQPTTFSNRPTSPWQGMTAVFTDSPSASFGGGVSPGSGGHTVEAVFGSDSVWRVSKLLST